MKRKRPRKAPVVETVPLVENAETKFAKRSALCKIVAEDIFSSTTTEASGATEPNKPPQPPPLPFVSLFNFPTIVSASVIRSVCATENARMVERAERLNLCPVEWFDQLMAYTRTDVVQMRTQLDACCKKKKRSHHIKQRLRQNPKKRHFPDMVKNVDNSPHLNNNSSGGGGKALTRHGAKRPTAMANMLLKFAKSFSMSGKRKAAVDEPMAVVEVVPPTKRTRRSQSKLEEESGSNAGSSVITPAATVAKRSNPKRASLTKSKSDPCKAVQSSVANQNHHNNNNNNNNSSSSGKGKKKTADKDAQLLAESEKVASGGKRRPPTSSTWKVSMAPIASKIKKYAELPQKLQSLFKDLRFREILRDEENKGYWLRELPEADFRILTKRYSSSDAKTGEDGYMFHGIETKCNSWKKSVYDILFVPTSSISPSVMGEAAGGNAKVVVKSNSKLLSSSSSSSQQLQQPAVTQLPGGSSGCHDNDLSSVEDILGAVHPPPTTHTSSCHPLDSMEGLQRLTAAAMMENVEPKTALQQQQQALLQPPIQRMSRPLPPRDVKRVYTKSYTRPSILRRNRASLPASVLRAVAMPVINFNAPLSATLHHNGGHHPGMLGDRKLPPNNTNPGGHNGARAMVSYSIGVRGMLPSNAMYSNVVNAAAVVASGQAFRHAVIRPPVMASHPRYLSPSLRSQLQLYNNNVDRLTTLPSLSLSRMILPAPTRPNAVGGVGGGMTMVGGPTNTFISPNAPVPINQSRGTWQVSKSAAKPLNGSGAK